MNAQANEDLQRMPPKQHPHADLIGHRGTEGGAPMFSA